MTLTGMIMTSCKGSVLSLFAAIVIMISFTQLVHAVHDGPCFTREDTNWMFPQEGLNPGLLPPEGHVPIGQLFGTGHQHYTSNGTAWVLTNATANLFNAQFEDVGIHFFLPEKDAQGGQPSWESSYPKSLVTCKVVFTVPQTNSIPWALLNATSSEGESCVFGNVTYVQRLDTQGGKAPNTAQDINATFASPYSTLYVYYKKL